MNFNLKRRFRSGILNKKD